MNYFRCTVGGSGKGNTVTVTCAEEFAGLTITLAKTGKTYTKTCPSTAPYVVTYYGVENGTYTVSCIVDGQTYSETVVVQDISCVLNYGFKWQTWVDAASQLVSSDYDTLDEVLADEKALRELFLEHACVDYMAEATSSSADLETIIENDLCAKWINNSDYALDFLYANEVIADLMDEADKYFYGEWDLVPQVPTMANNTAPSGVASASSEYSSSYKAWMAFEGTWSEKASQNIAWDSSANDVVGAWLQYAFPSVTRISGFKTIMPKGYSAGEWDLRASNDGSDFSVVLDSFTCPSGTIEEGFVYEKTFEDVSYRYYRLYRKTKDSALSTNETAVGELQFYAWAPKGNVPIMTSNTAPYGTVSYANQYDSGWPAYGVFTDRNTNWASTTKVGNYVGYKFPNPVCVKKVIAQIDTVATDACLNVSYKLQASNDGSTWADIASNGMADSTPLYADGSTYYLYWRIYITAVGTNKTYLKMYRVQFYGRELKVSVPTMTSNTAPYGEVSASSVHTTGRDYYAFDGDTGTAYTSTWGGGTGSWVAYDFKKQVKVYMGYARGGSDGQAQYIRDGIIIIQASNDGTTWEDISENITIPSSVSSTIPNAIPFETTPTIARYFRAYTIQYNITYDTGDMRIKELQFYGLDYSEKEFEAGTTKKWLYDHGVEFDGINLVGTNTVKGDSYVELNDNGGGFSNYPNTFDITPYNLLRANVGDVYNATAEIYCGSDLTIISQWTANNLPYTNALNVSNVNEVKPCGVYKINATKARFTELWLE